MRCYDRGTDVFTRVDNFFNPKFIRFQHCHGSVVHFICLSLKLPQSTEGLKKIAQDISTVGYLTNIYRDSHQKEFDTSMQEGNN